MNYIFLLNMSFFILSCVVIKNLYCTAKIRIFVISSLQKRVFFSHKVCKKDMFYNRRNKKCRFQYSVLSYYINLQPFSR